MGFLDQAGGICVGCAHWDRHRWFHSGNGCMKALPLTRSSTVDKCTVENCSGFRQKTIPDLSEGLCGRCLWWQPAHVSGRYCCTRQFDGLWMEKDHQGLVESCTLFKHREYRCVQCRHVGRPQNEDPCASCDVPSQDAHISQDMRAHYRGGRVEAAALPVKESNNCAHDEGGRTICPEIVKLEQLWNDARRQAQSATLMLMRCARRLIHCKLISLPGCHPDCLACAVDRFLKSKENSDG